MRFTALLIICLFSLPAMALDKESSFERVLRTGVIRCGYAVGRPYLFVDPNTKKISGLSYDVMNELGRVLKLKIEWVEEVEWANLPEAVYSGRVDMACSGAYATAARGKRMGFTRPVLFARMDAYARINDKRFDNNKGRINQEDVRIISKEGDMADEVVKAEFPKAQKIYAPQLSGEDFLFLGVVDGKGDVLLTTTNYALNYMKERPDALRKVPLDAPIRYFGLSYGVSIYEGELLKMIDTALGQLLQSGDIDRIIDKHEKDYPDSFLRVAKPYEVK